MKYFKDSEFDCKCGKCGLGLAEMDEGFIAKLVQVRRKANVPFVLNSAMRCKEHNKNEGGGENSSHLRGLAVDVKCVDSKTRMWLVKLFCHYFTRVGVDKTFIHIDDDREKVQDRLWVY